MTRTPVTSATARRLPTPRLRLLAASFLAALGAGTPAELAARAPVGAAVHEVPADVAVQAYVRPVGRTLTVLVRVPLESMRDVELPLRGGSGGPGRYLDLAHPELDRILRDAARLWIAGYLRFWEDGEPLGEEQVVTARVSLPSDRSFTSWEDAFAHVLGRDPVPPEVELPPGQAHLDVLLELPIESAEARFSVEPELAHLGMETRSVVHFLPPEGGERVFTYEGNPGRVELDPSWLQAFLRFVEMGFVHILGGLDHLLFVLCLVIPFRSLRGLIPVVTAFTLAHSITLLAAALGLAPAALWFGPLVETLIAASIIWMALENIVGAKLSRRWTVAFGFGLVHGFGFSFVLSDALQFAGEHLVSSLLAFNVGVELGQIAVLLVAVPALELLFRKGVPERVGTILLSALVAHEAWHWMTARGGALLQYDLVLPPVDAAFWAAALRWAMLALICLGAGWVLSGFFRGWGEERRERREEAPSASPAGGD